MLFTLFFSLDVIEMRFTLYNKDIELDSMDENVKKSEIGPLLESIE